MKKRLFVVKEIMEITGITKRTLHYYDKINLLKPAYIAENGYRYYDQQSLARLQMILFLKEIDFPLKEIENILELPHEEQRQLLKRHSVTLIEKKQRLESIIGALDEYVSGKDVYSLHVFKHGSSLPLQQQYAREAKIIYNATPAYEQFEEVLAQLSDAEQESLFVEFEQNMTEVFRKLAACRNQDPASDDVQELINEWKSIMERTMVCDGEMLICLANAYKSDERFQRFINSFGDGDFVSFLYDAIVYYSEQLKSD